MVSPLRLLWSSGTCIDPQSRAGGSLAVQLDHVIDGFGIERDARLGREDAIEIRLKFARDDIRGFIIEHYVILVWVTSLSKGRFLGSVIRNVTKQLSL
jgi:hypothetical protein